MNDQQKGADQYRNSRFVPPGHRVQLQKISSSSSDSGMQQPQEFNHQHQSPSQNVYQRQMIEPVVQTTGYPFQSPQYLDNRGRAPSYMQTFGQSDIGVNFHQQSHQGTGQPRFGGGAIHPYTPIGHTTNSYLTNGGYNAHSASRANDAQDRKFRQDNQNLKQELMQRANAMSPAQTRKFLMYTGNQNVSSMLNFQPVAPTTIPRPQNGWRSDFSFSTPQSQTTPVITPLQSPTSSSHFLQTTSNPSYGVGNYRNDYLRHTDQVAQHNRNQGAMSGYGSADNFAPHFADHNIGSTFIPSTQSSMSYNNHDASASNQGYGNQMQSNQRYMFDPYSGRMQSSMLSQGVDVTRHPQRQTSYKQPYGPGVGVNIGSRNGLVGTYSQYQDDALPVTPSSVPKTGKKRKLDDTATEDSRKVEKSQKFDGLNHGSFTNRFSFGHEITARVQNGQTQDDAGGVVSDTPADVDQVGKSKPPIKRQKTMPTPKAAERDARRDVPAAEESGKYDDPSANEIWRAIEASQASESPPSTPELTSEIGSMTGQVDNIVEAPIMPVNAAVSATVEAEAGVDSIVDDSKLASIRENIELQHLLSTDRDQPVNDAGLAGLSQLATPQERDEVLNELMAASIQTNPSSLPSASHTPWQLNSLPPAPARLRKHTIAASQKTDCPPTVEEPESNEPDQPNQPNEPAQPAQKAEHTEEQTEAAVDQSFDFTAYLNDTDDVGAQMTFDSTDDDLFNFTEAELAAGADVVADEESSNNNMSD